MLVFCFYLARAKRVLQMFCIPWDTWRNIDAAVCACWCCALFFGFGSRSRVSGWLTKTKIKSCFFFFSRLLRVPPTSPPHPRCGGCAVLDALFRVFHSKARLWCWHTGMRNCHASYPGFSAGFPQGIATPVAVDFAQIPRLQVHRTQHRKNCWKRKNIKMSRQGTNRTHLTSSYI